MANGCKISEEALQRSKETRKRNLTACFLLHDTRNYCGLTREDFDEWLAVNPIKTTREIHNPSKYGPVNEEVYNKWRKRVADSMTAGFIENLKYSKIDYWLMITGSVEIDGKRYQIKTRVVKSEGEMIRVSCQGNEHRYYKKPSIYKAVLACLSGKGIKDFTMQYMAGRFLLHVYHDRGINMFEISRISKLRYDRFEKNNVMSTGYSEKYYKSLTTKIKKCEIDFFD